MDVVSLLRSKNKCLQRCLDLSIRFLADTETGDLSTLPLFESHRAAVFKTIDLYDRKITEAVRALAPEKRTPELIESVRAELEAGERVVRRIIDADNRVMSRIESERERLSVQLRSSDRSRAAISKFKSGWVAEPGEGIDTKL